MRSHLWPAVVESPTSLCAYYYWSVVIVTKSPFELTAEGHHQHLVVLVPAGEGEGVQDGSQHQPEVLQQSVKRLDGIAVAEHCG